MASTLPNMGLRSWDAAGDNFSYTELSANWTKVDQHDHTTGKGVQIPTAGLVNLAVTGPKIAAGAIDSSKILDGSVADVDLASPNNGVYRMLGEIASNWTTDSQTGVCLFRADGSGFVTSGSTAPFSLHLFHLDPTLYAVAGKTTRLRTHLTYAQNAVASAATFQIGLHLITMAGTADAFVPTAAAAISGSTASIATPSASATGAVSSSDFNFPSAGLYALCVTVTGTNGANAATNFMGRLFIRHT